MVVRAALFGEPFEGLDVFRYVMELLRICGLNSNGRFAVETGIVHGADLDEKPGRQVGRAGQDMGAAGRTEVAGTWGFKVATSILLGRSLGVFEAVGRHADDDKVMCN